MFFSRPHVFDRTIRVLRLSFTFSGSDWSSDQEDEKKPSGFFEFDNPS